MNTLQQLTNVERARLLYSLFREEIPVLLDFVVEFGKSIKENEEVNHANWDNGFMGFDFWLSLLDNVEARIIHYKKPLIRNGKLFADQLFDGYLAIYSAQALRAFVGRDKHTDPKFKTAVDLFFNL